jgi:hypothetical protein
LATAERTADAAQVEKSLESFNKLPEIFWGLSFSIAAPQGASDGERLGGAHINRCAEFANLVGR